MGVAGNRPVAEGGPSIQRALVQLFPGPVVGACARSPSATSAPSFLWPPAWSWRLWPWDFPSLLPEAVTHKTQGTCPESPFFRPGLGTQTLWGQGSPRQLNALCAAPTLLSLPLPHRRK